VEIEIGTETFMVRAEEPEGADREALWSKLVAASASLREYRARASRPIPVFMLTRTD
jgi:F420H(2)-dependent quinone reductase